MGECLEDGMSGSITCRWRPHQGDTGARLYGMIRKNGNRLSEEIMLNSLSVHDLFRRSGFHFG
jgi:hypothetical protein